MLLPTFPFALGERRAERKQNKAEPRGRDVDINE